MKIDLQDPRPVETHKLTVCTSKGTLILVYRRPSDDELDADQWRSALAIKSDDAGGARAAVYRHRREATIVGWEGVTYEAGKPIEFTQPRLLSLMLKVPQVEQSLIELLGRLYEIESVRGEPEPPPDAGTGPVESNPSMPNA